MVKVVFCIKESYHSVNIHNKLPVLFVVINSVCLLGFLFVL